MIQQHVRYPITIGVSTVHEHIRELSGMSSQLDEVFRARLTRNGLAVHQQNIENVISTN
ncbi:hypothetical protein RQP52_27280 [Paenibacillus sp. PFR10]|uniref:Uncharacterized protein n=2 Tax=Paenibacillus TaxID=44249 RepID=A0ABU3RKR5_9BACL|nr:hypothetical protein [Paenibacillus sp. PFR10]